MTSQQPPDELKHDQWFRRQVQSTLERVAQGEERLIPHDEFWEGMEAYARELLKRGT